jgi:hypothetical protein
VVAAACQGLVILMLYGFDKQQPLFILFIRVVKVFVRQWGQQAD